MAEDGGRRGQNIPRPTRVKNKTAASVQITAEQILREAMERTDTEIKAPKQRIMDPDELAEYRLRKRRTFEDAIRRNRALMANWLKYAAWEEGQNELERARSVYERAVDVDYRNTGVWLKYAEMEMRVKNVNAARNIWDRAVTLLPRVDQLWLKYSYMEDLLGNYAGARAIFERWIEWQPDPQAWHTFIRFELRCGEISRVRKIYERFVEVHPLVSTFLKWARFEASQNDRDASRKVYERAIEFLGEEANDEKFFIAFAKFEEDSKEFERARAIYKYSLDHIPKKDAQNLYKMWITFEKKNGERDGIEEVIVGKRRFQYEEEIKDNPNNYDTWFDYTRLEESYGDIEKTRDIYERAIANVPPATEKRFWRRYIYLWINYALFEELEARDTDKAREVYKEAVRLVPHKAFSFSKLFVMYAHFEIRQKNLAAARSIFGHALGVAPKAPVFTAYIAVEMQLGNVDRCRTIYEKYLTVYPNVCDAWVKFSQLERDLGETDRARALYELAISQPQLDMPELLWKTYIDFEIEQEEHGRARELYRRLLERTKHVKVWISFAQFEASIGLVKAAREIYAKAFTALKDDEKKEDRVMLVESWKEFAQQVGDPAYIAEVEKRTPRRVIKKRRIILEDGTEGGWEEYYDYIFPGEDQSANLKILERAKQWKKMQEEKKAAEAESADS
eukprot:TRINITY_DN5171_c0_g1_i1.p1 TRINITY_DN5171_c0_g1~~TRINITY_DN5171_c0_g1_i1.p1  ORF type:complete len:677 (+),score=289.84 TRINITY_DN5171_c0_g1_i1:159-2189(+)